MSIVVGFSEIDATQVSLVGGKGASLGELSRIDGVSVPPGFCVTTEAFRRAQSGGVPDEVATAIRAAVGDGAYAVRSSATAEDLPTASFAGQHDSFLNVVGADAVLEHVERCWASLFTEHAVAYRRHHGFEHVEMAVVVQEMVDADAAGVLFTADPLTSNRHVSSIEAVFGLGEALVSGQVNPDTYKVRDGAVVEQAVAGEPPLTAAQAVELARLGRLLEAHFGRPQDIEWCLADGGFQIVQSRPITTLFPIPVVDDDDPHVYVSVGHGQMMTDPMKPLGLSLFQLTAMPVMLEAAGRLFVDVAPRLASPAMRGAVLEALGKGDPLIGDALQTLLDRGFIPSVADAAPAGPPAGAAAPPRPAPPIDNDPAIVSGLIDRCEASNAALARAIEPLSGTALVEFILADIPELKRVLFDPLSSQAIMAGMDATWWLNDQLEEWLGIKNAADTLSQSVPGNITAEMGLALLDVADAIRPYPDVVAFLETAGDDFLERLGGLDGGPQAREAVQAYLDRYGVRCVGEIDITRPRWRERPSTLLPLLLANVRNFEPGAGKRRFEAGRQEAAAKEQEVLARLSPDRAAETKRMIDRVRIFNGYREYPKYFIVSRYFIYKQALLRLGLGEDIFWLTFQELRTGTVDHELIAERKRAFNIYEALTPPRVLTSEGEVVTGSYRREDLPPGALIGLAVSSGTVEGRARVIHDLAEADLEADDILVTAYTDPSWSPLFVAIKGLVTEVGGLMTHGAVVAREYGLPAVVGVENATRLIEDGQRIRLHGTEGYIEILT